MVPLHRALTARRRFVLLLAAAVAFGGSRAALADGTPGDFDFYVLALTWSPSYCRNDERPDPAQCAAAPPGFVIHGLWPQYERGYPEYCAPARPPRLSRSVLAYNADLIASPGAAGYQWRKHGVCSGLRPERYFQTMRRAAGAVAIPKGLIDPQRDVGTSPRAVEAAFREANPGLSERGMAVTCNRQGVIEVRICLTRSLAFRRCSEVDADGCRRRTITLPDNGPHQ